MNFSRQQAPEAHQKRDELDLTAGPEAPQKRDELVLTAGPRGPPEEG